MKRNSSRESLSKKHYYLLFLPLSISQVTLTHFVHAQSFQTGDLGFVIAQVLEDTAEIKLSSAALLDMTQTFGAALMHRSLLLTQKDCRAGGKSSSHISSGPSQHWEGALPTEQVNHYSYIQVSFVTGWCRRQLTSGCWDIDMRNPSWSFIVKNIYCLLECIPSSHLECMRWHLVNTMSVTLLRISKHHKYGEPLAYSEEELEELA